MNRLLCFVGWAFTLGFLGTLGGQEKKPEPPQVLVANPLGIIPGQTTKVLLRGLKLDEAKEVRLNGKTDGVKFLSAAKSAPPNQQEAKRAGDTQVEVEFTLPTDVSPGEAALVVVTPAGETKAYSLLIGSKIPWVAEKEGNDGFRQAQIVEVPQTIEGIIHGGQNVDVFAVTAAADGRLVAEVIAAERGSSLDGVLSVFDERGTLITQNDDEGNSRDPRVRWSVKTGTKYFVVLQDANDLGGPAHPYRLTIRAD